MRLSVDKNSAIPIYKQIIEHVKEMIATRDAPPGSFLPPVRQVAADLNINPMTVSKAYSQLHAAGLITRIPGKGMQVNHVSLVDGAVDLKTGIPTIGMVFQDVTYVANPAFPPLLLGMKEAADQSGFRLQFCPVQRSEISAFENRFFASLLDENLLAGLILMSPLHTSDLLSFQKRKIPFVTQSNEYPQLELPCILTDVERQVEYAVKHLYQTGHRRIALVTGPLAYEGTETITAGRRAAEAFISRLTALGMIAEESPIRNIPWEVAAASSAVQELVTSKDPPTALIVSGTLQAAGALHALARQRLSPIKDVEMAQIMSETGNGSPGLVVQSNLFEMGRESVLLLDNILKNKPSGEKRYVVHCLPPNMATSMEPANHIPILKGAEI